MLLNFRGKEVDFKGTVNHHSIPTRDVAFGSNVRVCLIADLHGYTNDENRMRRLAERIAKEFNITEFIFTCPNEESLMIFSIFKEEKRSY